MTIFLSGYLQDSNKWTQKGRNHGTLTILNDVIFFNGRKGREVNIPLKDIKNAHNEGIKVIMNMKAGNLWSFAISPYWRAISITEAIQFKKEAETLSKILNHFIKEGEA